MSQTNSNLSPLPQTSRDNEFDRSLRPQFFDEFVGQNKTKEQLKVFVQAARMRSEALDHVLIFGPPGLGKTTLAHIIANELKVQLEPTSGPVLVNKGDVAGYLTRLQERSVWFVDEIHRLNPVVEEFLYPAMEDFRIDIMIGQGPAAKSIQLDLNSFTLVGATTRTGLLTSPLRGRFGIVHRLDFYHEDDLAKIIHRSARILAVSADNAGVTAIAKCARGTPRIANRLLRRVRDYAQVKGDGTINQKIAEYALDMLEVDRSGLDVLDRKYLQVLLEHHHGGPTGIETLAAAIGEERGTLEDMIEPFLLQQGFIQRTPRGRTATAKAWQHMGLEPNNQSPSDLLL